MSALAGTVVAVLLVALPGYFAGRAHQRAIQRRRFRRRIALGHQPPPRPPGTRDYSEPPAEHDHPLHELVGKPAFGDEPAAYFPQGRHLRVIRP